MSKLYDVDVGIITYSGAHRVRSLVRSIKKWEDDENSCHIVLVDDGSPNPQPSRDVAKEFELQLVEHGNNRGIAAAWNTCVRSLDTPYVVLLNDDILVTRDWLRCMRFFLENNPQAASASWPFHFITEADVPIILQSPEPVRISRDPITKEPVEDRTDAQINSSPGAIMCVAGCCFGFRREMFELAGGFDERYISFHEESDFGTTLAARGYSSFGLPYPLLYHIWSATFGDNPELQPSERMVQSRKRYCEKWGVPLELHDDPFKYTHPKYMSKIEPIIIKWLSPDLTVRKVEVVPS